jgi:hypothetical protein
LPLLLLLLLPLVRRRCLLPPASPQRSELPDAESLILSPRLAYPPTLGPSSETPITSTRLNNSSRSVGSRPSAQGKWAISLTEVYHFHTGLEDVWAGSECNSPPAPYPIPPHFRSRLWLIYAQSSVPRDAHGPCQDVLEIRHRMVQRRRDRLGARYQGLYAVGEAKSKVHVPGAGHGWRCVSWLVGRATADKAYMLRRCLGLHKIDALSMFTFIQLRSRLTIISHFEALRPIELAFQPYLLHLPAYNLHGFHTCCARNLRSMLSVQCIWHVFEQ